MLTPRQNETFEFIRKYINDNDGQSPSYDEIRRYLGLRSYNAVSKLLKQLESKGYITSPWGNKKRAIRIEVAGGEGRFIPMLGLVAAGQPLDVSVQPDLVEVPESLLGNGEHYGLRVQGTSMIDDGIHDGDLIIVKKQETAEKGQTIVALVDGEATIKRFYANNSKVELRPSNPAMAPIFVHADQLAIQGIVVGLIRKFTR